MSAAGRLPGLYVATGGDHRGAYVRAILTVEVTRQGGGGYRVRRQHSGDIVGRAGMSGAGEVEALADALAGIFGMTLTYGAGQVWDRSIPGLVEYAAGQGIGLYGLSDLVDLAAAAHRGESHAARLTRCEYRHAEARQAAADAATRAASARDRSDKAEIEAARLYSLADDHEAAAAVAAELLADLEANRLFGEADEAERRARMAEAESVRWAAEAREAEADAERLAVTAAEALAAVENAAEAMGTVTK